MTVNYSLQVSSTDLGTFFRLLARWKGSVLKCLYKETMVYFLIYALISSVYRNLLNEPQKRIFEKVSQHCEHSLTFIPITFVLGFYISIVFARWMNIQNAIAWPDKVALSLVTYMDGSDSQSKVYRVSIVRYLIAAEILVLRDISAPVQKRFPTLQHLVSTGLFTQEELELYQNVPSNHAKYWIPIEWSLTIIKRAHKEKLIDNFYVPAGHILDYRGKLGLLLDYDWVPIPLVYTQVVCIAVWAYFGTCLLARQFLDTSQAIPGHDFDFYFPIFTLLQFIFYMGWLKVAECMINPLGEDDDDLELNYIIDRNVEVAFLQANDMCGRLPRLKPDQHLKIDISHLPYTSESVGVKNAPLIPSCSKMKIQDEEKKKLK